MAESVNLTTIDKRLEKRPNYVDDQFHFKLAASLNQLKIDKSLCDVTIVCGNERIMAHKIVLAAASEYFCAMFAGGLSESNLNEIELKDVAADAVKDLIDYAYTGAIHIDDSNVQSLVGASDLLQFKAAKEYCGYFIASQIDASNCLEIYQFSDQYSYSDLACKALAFFKFNFSDMLDSEQFLSLSFPLLKKLLQSDDILVKGEKDILSACFEWMQHDAVKRSTYLNELLQSVKFSFIGPRQLLDTLDRYAIKDLSLQVKKIQLFPTNAKYIRYKKMGGLMRSSYQQWLHVFGGERSFLNEINDIECFSYHKESWELCKPLKAPRSSFAAVVIGKKLYIVGGIRTSVKLRSAKCYDSETGKWTTLPPPLKCRGDVKAAAIGEMLYVAGGSGDRESACRNLERYDPVAKAWTRLQKMKSCRRRFNLIALNGLLYALGGFDDKQGDLNSVEHYDPSANSWTQDAPMVTARSDFGAVALSGHIYAVGGVNGTRGSMESVEKYDPVKGGWEQCASMLDCRGGLSVAVYFGRIVAFSGINIYMSSIETAEYYDEVENKWYPFPSLRIARSGSVAVCLPFKMPRLPCQVTSD